jgi:hypothetical protein
MRHRNTGLQSMKSWESNYRRKLVRHSIICNAIYHATVTNTTIMVLEYNFPSTAEVVSKYAAPLGIRKKARLMIAKAAVQVENVIRIWRRENKALTGQHHRLNNQARYFATNRRVSSKSDFRWESCELRKDEKIIHIKARRNAPNKSYRPRLAHHKQHYLHTRSMNR